MLAYHDLEWGVPLHDERSLFELLVLEGAQAGLSWSTILKRREAYRAAFADFDVARVAGFADAEVDRLLNDSGIIRNRQKITATLENARRVLAFSAEGASLSGFVWSFVGGTPLVHGYTSLNELPAKLASSPEHSSGRLGVTGT